MPAGTVTGIENAPAASAVPVAVRASPAMSMLTASTSTVAPGVVVPTTVVVPFVTSELSSGAVSVTSMPCWVWVM